MGWICIKKERFPRVFSTRRLIKDGSEYFGPYTNFKTVHTLLDLIKGLYPLRSCNYDLAQQKISNGKYKVCLEYHLGNCLGPCENLHPEASYNTSIDAIRNLLKGNFKESLGGFKNQMKQYAANLQFEDAQRIKEKIEALENYQSKSTIVNPNINNVDVFSVISDESYGYVNFLQLSFGSIIRSHTLEVKKKLDETDAQLLELCVMELRQRFNSQSKEVYVPFTINVEAGVKLHIPKLGDKKTISNFKKANFSFFNYSFGWVRTVYD